LEGFLSEVQGIRMPDGKLTMEFCTQLIAALSPSGAHADRGYSQDIYISYGWHPQEQPAIKHIGRFFHKQKFRLIGDAPDQPKFLLTDDYEKNDKLIQKEKKKQRIREIMSSCNAVLAVVPYREKESRQTSEYILEEIELAHELKLPLVIIKDPQVKLDNVYTNGVAHIADIPMAADQLKAIDATLLDQSVQALQDALLPKPQRDHYVFYSTDINPDNAARNRAVRDVVQAVTGMPCKFGKAIDGQENIYRQIIKDIRNAFVMLADLSGRRPNILIEAGIAIGAEVHIHYLESRQAVEILPSKSPPVMLGGIQSHHYVDEVELLGHIHRLMYPYRRLVLNRRLTN
jgi:hypothetical protein